MKNLGSNDRIIRAAVGGQMAPRILSKSIGNRLLGLVGIFALVTAAVGFCPVYDLLEIDTSHNK